MRRKLTALFLSCALFTGCYTNHRFPSAPIPVRLATPSGFQLVQAATNETAASSCTVRRAEVEFTALSGDTLYFANAKVLSQVPGAQLCANVGAGFVALADYPELRAERMMFNEALTWSAAIFVGIPVAIFATFVISCLFSPC